MSCQHCRAETVPGARVCIRCGKSLPCDHRGAALPAGAAFCPDCGVLLRPQRRHVTILVCDLVGSTKLLRSRDPEDYSKIVHAFLETGADVVAQFGGHVEQHLGDALYVFFGWPQAQEDDASRAVRAGLGILEALDRLNPGLERAHGVRVSARITIDTGLGVDDMVGGGEWQERLLVGQATHDVNHLKSVARPDTVVITDNVYRLVEGYFDVRDLGPRELKDEGRIVAAYEIVRERLTRTRLDALGPAGLTPLVGRDHDLRLLRDLWQEVKAGHGRAVLLGGEAGIGKSRLVRSLREEILADDAGTWSPLCQAALRSQHTAFHPFVDLVDRELLEPAPREGSDNRLRRLERWLEQQRQPLEETAPIFAELLAIPVPSERYPSRGGETPLVPEAALKKARTQAALLKLVRERASTNPVLFVLEDLHWADASTLEVLKLLLQDIARHRILVVLTFRPAEFTPADDPPWARSDVVTRTTLGRLGREHSARIANWSLRGPRLPEELLRAVLDRADGNPLFIEELSKWARDLGASNDAKEALTLSIPATLQSSLMARLDRLGQAKTVAEIGAVLGREFSYDVLSAVSGLGDAPLAAALDQLVDAEIVYRTADRPDSGYVFKHALVQKAAYDTILKESRPGRHRRIAEVLEQRFPDVMAKQPELIAHHYIEAGLTERAIPYLEQAGHRALHRAANAEAIAHLERALKFLSGVPQTRLKDEQELRVVSALAPAYMAIKGWASDDVESTCRRARELGRQLGDFERTYRAQWGLWTKDFLRGRLDQALETSKEVLQMATSAAVVAEDTATAKVVARILQVTSRHAVGYTHFYRGEFPEVCEHAEHAKMLFDEASERIISREFQFSSTVALRIMHGESLWMLGFPERAAIEVQSGVALSRQLGHRPSEAFALGASLLLHAYSRDAEQTATTAKELRRLAEEQGNEIWGPFALIFQGWIRAERSEPHQGVEDIRAGLDGWRATNNQLNQTIAMALLGHSLRMAGRSDEAIDVLAAEIIASEERHELQYAPELHRLQGEIWSDRGSWSQSEECFGRALRMARQQQALMLEMRAAVSLGKLLERTGRADSAGQLVADLYRRFAEGFGTRDLCEAREFLDRVGAANTARNMTGPARFQSV